LGHWVIVIGSSPMQSGTNAPIRRLSNLKPTEDRHCRDWCCLFTAEVRPDRLPDQGANTISFTDEAIHTGGAGAPPPRSKIEADDPADSAAAADRDEISPGASRDLSGRSRLASAAMLHRWRCA